MLENVHNGRLYPILPVLNAIQVFPADTLRQTNAQDPSCCAGFIDSDILN
jgi:hypothetical protein